MALVEFRTVVVLTVLVLAGATAAAQDPNLYNAEADLEAAWGHLQATPYGGKHREKALDHVRKALEEARKAGLESFPGAKEQREQLKREYELERKRQKHEDHLQRKQQQREQELEEEREQYGY